MSADTVNAGLDRYAYVGDNPETFTDPSGHCGMMTNTPGNPQCGSGQSGGGGGDGSGDSTGSGGCDSEVCSSGGYPGLGSGDGSNNYTTATPTATGTPTATVTSASSTQQGCDAECQARNGAWDEIKKAVLWGGGAFLAIALACAVSAGLLCQSAFWIGAPTIAAAVRDILDGLQTLHNLDGGVVGSMANFMFSTGKVAVDVLTIALSWTGFKFFLRNAVRLARGLGLLGQALLAGMRGLSGQARAYVTGAGTDLLIAAVGAVNLMTDLQDLQTNSTAFFTCQDEGYMNGCPEQ